MSEYYIEMIEETTEDNEFKPKEHFLKYVEDEAEAESVYATQKDKFKATKIKAQYVEMNHNKDASKNQPCVSREIKDGKVESKSVDTE